MYDEILEASKSRQTLAGKYQLLHTGLSIVKDLWTALQVQKWREILSSLFDLLGSDTEEHRDLSYEFLEYVIRTPGKFTRSELYGYFDLSLNLATRQKPSS